MNKRLKDALKERIKDMGLTSKALDELSELSNVADDASDEDIAKAVDSLAPFAKAMQAEITRKTQKNQTNGTQSEPKPSVGNEGERQEGGQSGSGTGDDVPAWFKTYQKQTDAKLKSLLDENAALKADTARKSRLADINERAKSMGIPDYLMKHISIAEDADIEKELTSIKQDLVTNNLMPQEAGVQTDPDATLKAEAKNWAESLPSL